MSIDTNKAALHRFRDALSKGEMETAFSVFSPNVVIHMGSAPAPMSLAEFGQFGRLMFSAFSNPSSTVEDVIAEGDKVVSRVTFRGTHTGEMMGIPPTNKSVAITETIIDRFVDGKIVESWRLFDQMAMMQQLGLIPAPQ